MRSGWRASPLILLLVFTAGFAEPVAERIIALEPPLPLLSPEPVWQFYQSRQFHAAWLGPDCIRRVGELLVAIDSAFEHGLEPADYHRQTLSETDTCGEATEWLATDAWISLASHLHAGRVDPQSVEPDWTATRPSIDMAALLQQALAEERMVATLLGLAPDDPFYASMREALARYRGYLGRGGWSGVETGPALRKGETHSQVVQLRARLARSGLLDAAESDELFDETLETAVKAFQRRANLEPDGVVGALTLAQLNRPVEERIEQLRVNLERWRWLPENGGERHLRVNIANFTVQAWSGGRVEQEHKVIVGSLYRQTPSFSGLINQIVFNPWWETPHRLAVQDKLPLFSRKPEEVGRLGFEVLDANGMNVDPQGIDWSSLSATNFPYRLRQRPGPQNALGQIKMLFPNRHSVYLHDTPTQGLFSRVRRNFSSGCIRVEDALDLSAWLLRDATGWDRAAINAAVASGKETSVRVSPEVPVHLLYLTVARSEDGEIRFIDDLYGRDTNIAKALSARHQSGL
jgi:murein L,D-transpeptidase YcbB/YkuD